MWRAARRLGSLSVRSGVGVRSISSVTATKLFASLRAPIIAAPMFIVSNPDLVIAQCKVRAVACARPVQWPVHGLCLARAWHACYALLHMQHAHMHVHAPVLSVQKSTTLKRTGRLLFSLSVCRLAAIIKTMFFGKSN